MSKYVLNIKTGIIHNAVHPCHLAKRIKKANKKSFNLYRDAVNYYDSDTEKGRPCALCCAEKQ